MANVGGPFFDLAPLPLLFFPVCVASVLSLSVRSHPLTLLYLTLLLRSRRLNLLTRLVSRSSGSAAVYSAEELVEQAEESGINDLSSSV